MKCACGHHDVGSRDWEAWLSRMPTANRERALNALGVAKGECPIPPAPRGAKDVPGGITVRVEFWWSFEPERGQNLSAGGAVGNRTPLSGRRDGLSRENRRG